MNAFLSDKRVGVTGGGGFLGLAVCARLRAHGAGLLSVPRSSDYDLTRAEDVAGWFDHEGPDVIIHLAAASTRAGGKPNPAGDVLYADLIMGLNLIQEARRRNVAKFVLIGNACAYPQDGALLLREENLWDGLPASGDAARGIATRTLGFMLETCRADHGFNGVHLIPTDLYGPGDDFEPENARLIPALIQRMGAAVENRQHAVTCCGPENRTREFLFVEDAAEAIVTAAEIHNDPRPINLGTGREVSTAELAGLIANLCGFRGEIEWIDTVIDGPVRRALDTTRAASWLNWQATTELEDGLSRTIAWWKRTHVPAPAVG